MSIKQQAQVIISVSIMCVCILIFGAGIRRGEWIEYPITNIEQCKSSEAVAPKSCVKLISVEYNGIKQEVYCDVRHRSDKGFDYIRIYENGFYEVYLVNCAVY